jgi:hypothetical protein
LFDTAVILLYPVVQVHIRPMHHRISQGLAHCTGIGTMPVCRDRIWRLANYSQSVLEELFGRIHVPLFTQPRINQIAILVNGPIQIPPLSTDFHGGFINIPQPPCLTTPRGFASDPQAKEQTALPRPERSHA